MKRFFCSLIGFFSKRFLKKIDFSQNDDEKIKLTFQENLIKNTNLQSNIQQCEINSLNLDLFHKTIVISKVAFMKEQPQSTSKKFVEKNLFTYIIDALKFLLSPFFNILSLMLNLICGEKTAKFKNFFINLILKNYQVKIATLTIDIELPIKDSQEKNNFQLALNDIEFTLLKINSNLYDFTIRCQKNGDTNALAESQMSNDIIFYVDFIHAFIDLNNFSFNFELTEFSIQYKNQSIQMKNVILNSFSNDFLLNVESIDLIVQLNDIIEIINYLNWINSTKTKEKSSAKTFDFNIDFVSISIQIIENKFEIMFSINGKITNLIMINLINFSALLDEKVICKPFSININDKIYEIESNLNIYLPLFKINLIDEIIKKIRTIKLSKNNSKNDIKEKKENIITTKEINIFLIKSNSPLLLLNIKSIDFIYPLIKTSQLTKEIIFSLKHFSRGTYDPYKHVSIRTYDIINHFSLIFTLKKNSIDIKTISPIIIILSSFLFKELSLPERNDLLFSEFDEKKIFFQNDTNETIKLTLIDNNQQYCQIELRNNYPIGVNELNYNHEIKLNFNNSDYYFSIKSLYSPIFINEILLATLSSDNGARTIHFSSPYIIKNELLYNIEVHINNINIESIESGKEKFIPCSVNFSLQSEIKVATFPVNKKFIIIDIKDANPKKLIHDDKLYYFQVYLSFDSQKSICSIIFVPYFTFVSYLPFVKLTLMIKGKQNKIKQNEIEIKEIETKQIEIKQNKPIDLSYFDSKMEFNLDFHGFATMKKSIKMGKISEQTEEILLFIDENQIGNIIFKCSSKIFNNKIKIFEISLYAPLILINESSIPLFLTTASSNPYSFIDNRIFYSNSQIRNHDCMISLPLYIPTKTLASSINFQYLVNISQMILLKHINDDKIYCLLSLLKHESEYKDSAIVTINSYFRVISSINENFYFIASYKDDHNVIKEYKNQCSEGTNIIIGSKCEGDFDLSIEGYERCKNINFFNVGTSLIKLIKSNKNGDDDNNSYLIVKIVITKEENGYCCHISYPDDSSNIVNNLNDKNLYVYQHYQMPIDSNNDFVYHSIVIKPNEELIFAKEQPFLKNELNDKYKLNVAFDENGQQKPLSFENNCREKIIGDYIYDVNLTNREKKRIIIYEKKDNNSGNNINDNGSNSIINIGNNLADKSFSFNFLGIQVSYIDDEMHELVLLALKNIDLNFKNNTLKLVIEGFAIDDMYSVSPSPVVLNGKEAPFLEISVVSTSPFKMLMFDDISIKLNPIQVFIDFPFVCDLIAVMKEISEYMNQLKSSLLSSSSSESSNNNKKNFLMNIFSSKKIFIDKIYADLMPLKLSGREFRFKHPDYFNILKSLIIFEKKFAIELKEMNERYVEAPIIDFLKSTLDFYKNQFPIGKILNIAIKGIVKNENSIPKSFDDYLNVKNQFRKNNYDDKILEYPRRLPMAFPKGEFIIIPTFFIEKYPDMNTKIQYRFQRFNKGAYRDEKLHELYIDVKNNNIGIFDNYILVCNENDEFEMSIKNNIKKIEIANKIVTIKSGPFNRNVFEFSDEKQASQFVNKIISIQKKINISEQTIFN